jgi:DTW domain-containing protein YfiP
VSRDDDQVELRCSSCRLPDVLCVCALLPRLETRTRLVLIIHRNEERKPTNSGLLATRCLVHSDVMVRGLLGQPEPRWQDDPARQALLLFPHPRAIPIGHFAASPRPPTLIVPDGTWRQAAKVPRRVAGLGDLPYVTLPAGVLSSYRLRAQDEPGRVSTMEAIACALGVLEGAAVRQALERVFRVMVERTLWLRGSLPSAQVTGGIPERALANDPRGRPGSVLVRYDRST